MRIKDSKIQKTVVVVDSFSSGNLIAPSLKKNGYHTISLLSAPIPGFYKASYVSSDFDEEISLGQRKLENEVSELAKYFKSINVKAVIPGCESGVILADMLSSLLDLDHNDLERSTHRRNKFLMQHALAEFGVRSIRQFLSDDMQSILNWSKSLSYEVVIKPSESAGTDHVYVCHTSDDVCHAFESILSAENIFNQRNTQVLAQEFIHGREYVVDTVSYKGFHTVTNICEYHKLPINNSMVYRSVDFIEPKDPNFKNLVAYCFSALDALGIRHGSAHNEIKIDQSGPVLIESGARMQGSGIPSYIKDFSNFSQLELMLDAYLFPEDFKAKSRLGNKYHKNACIFGFINRDGFFVRNVCHSKVKELPSHYSSVFRYKSGDFLSATTSMLDCPGWVFLMHDDKKVLDRDFSQLLHWEAGNQIFEKTKEIIKK